MAIYRVNPGDLITADLFNGLVKEVEDLEGLDLVDVPDLVTGSLSSAITSLKRVPLSIAHVIDVDGATLSSDPDQLSNEDRKRIVLTQMPAAGDRVDKSRSVALLVTEKVEAPVTTKPIITDVSLGKPPERRRAKGEIADLPFDAAETKQYATIEGSGFSSDKQKNKVTFNEVTVEVVSASSDQIVVTSSAVKTPLETHLETLSSDQLRNLKMLDHVGLLKSDAKTKYLPQIGTVSPNEMSEMIASEKVKVKLTAANARFSFGDSRVDINNSTATTITVVVTVDSVASDPYYFKLPRA